ncbi:MAG TPA: hypothetical protein ENJ28_03030 [Gammaproteobacteria bacterium]|nr:hypothetical protein [Gammaproteobacteria bacterium]
MKEIVDAIGTRIKSPYFGYAVFAFIALNWRALFILLLSDVSPQERILEFNNETSIWTLLVLPLSFGFIVALSSPWLRLFFESVSRKPFELTDTLKLEAQHKNTIKQAELEQSRSNLFAIKEKELIERAKRDEEVAEITDEETKERLSQELEQLRKERDKLSSELSNRKNKSDPLSDLLELSNKAAKLLLEAAKDKNGTIMVSNTLGGRSFQVGSETFGKENSREFSKYEEGLEELVTFGFVKERGGKGEIFELTNKGWKASNVL